MRLSLAFPLSALMKSAVLMAVFYALSVPALAPLRPDVGRCRGLLVAVCCCGLSAVCARLKI